MRWNFLKKKKKFVATVRLPVSCFNPANGFHLVESVQMSFDLSKVGSFNPANGFHLVERLAEAEYDLHLGKFQSRERVSFS